jgi:D-alanyl-D-alanine carboxypeptidase
MRALTGGFQDENDLTNLIFFARHPGLRGRKLTASDPQSLKDEWMSILKTIVRPAIRRMREAGAKSSDGSVPTVVASKGYIPAEKLPKFGTEEQHRFMQKVYEVQRKNSAKERSFVNDIPENQLEEIEKNIKITLRKDAASFCRSLLAAAREDLKQQKLNGVQSALRVESIGVASGYRTATQQFNNWRGKFKDYYDNTKTERTKLYGGEHGEEAVQYLASYISKLIASPGYSLHNSGIAVDFKTRDNKMNLGPDSSQRKQRRNSWFYNWLTANASNFHFHENRQINEPWHSEYKPASAG